MKQGMDTEKDKQDQRLNFGERIKSDKNFDDIVLKGSGDKAWSWAKKMSVKSTTELYDSLNWKNHPTS